MQKRFVTNDEVTGMCAEIAVSLPWHKAFYGVPRGGIAVAYCIAGNCEGVITDDPATADFIVDDLIDSGATRDHYLALYPNAKFIALYDFSETPKERWLVFPWEVTRGGDDDSATDIFTRLLEFVGEDPNREGLVETPKRMAKMFTEITSGYSEDPATYFKTFEENAGDYDQMIMVGPIPFYSMCEHHLAPFFGDAWVAYIPDKRFAGISKFARTLDTFAKRLQIQERLTEQVASTVDECVKPLGVGVIIRARHLCMEMRGAKKPGAKTTTSSMKGVFLTDPKARAEFLSLIKE